MAATVAGVVTMPHADRHERLSYLREWRDRNPEYGRRWHADHPGYYDRWRHENREHLRAYRRKWRRRIGMVT